MKTMFACDEIAVVTGFTARSTNLAVINKIPGKNSGVMAISTIGAGYWVGKYILIAGSIYTVVTISAGYTHSAVIEKNSLEIVCHMTVGAIFTGG